MKKGLLPITLITILSVYIYSCSSDDDDSAPPSVVQTPTPTPEPEETTTQYTLTVSAGEGGSVSTEGGTYDEGKSVSVTANPSDGYGFAGWTNFESNSSTINITLNSNTSVSASFITLPSLSMVSSSTSIFTKSKKDTLTFETNVPGGFNKLEINSDNGDVEIVSQPEMGATSGEIKLTYNPQKIVNIDYTRTIAGYEDISISVFDSYENNSSDDIRVKTQPEPIFNKDYLKPSHDLSISRNRIDINLIRYINQRDNLYQNWCDGINENLNQNGNSFDVHCGIAFADINNDGYDDILTHPIYQDNNGGKTTVELEYELYLYKNGSYVFSEINWGNKAPLKRRLARKILVGDYDNDGDPDFYSANQGLDIPPWTGEYNTFLINNYNLDGTFDYKEHDLLIGVHEASSADVDGDGDLDIFSAARRPSFQHNKSSKFFENTGNFNFTVWEDRMQTEYQTPRSHWRSTFHSELVDVDKDGNIDLIVMGHEWDYLYNWCQNETDGNCGRGKVYWGDSNGRYSEERKSLIPIVRNFGTSTDIDIVDLDEDGVNELIISRTGGDIDSFPDDADANPNDNIGTSNYYGGHYIQICKINSQRDIIDYSEELIDNNYLDSPQLFCTNPETSWFIHTRVEDYDGNGSLDLFNSLVDRAIQHRWEWKGSRFIKVSP